MTGSSTIIIVGFDASTFTRREEEMFCNLLDTLLKHSKDLARWNKIHDVVTQFVIQQSFKGYTTEELISFVDGYAIDIHHAIYGIYRHVTDSTICYGYISSKGLTQLIFAELE